ncbi:MAG: hypothetical protein CV089_12640 [Nitrospira sp. WS110]|nr:hypothetical protein [Nitrospira sp. WS110]
MTRCAKCRLGYSPEVPADRRLHRKIHDEAVFGVPGTIRRMDKVIWSDAFRKITVVRHRTASLAERNRAERVAQWARQDTDFDFAAYHARDSDDGRDAHVSLLHEADRIVGFLVMERRDFTRKLTWSEWDDPTAKGPYSEMTRGAEMWSIGMIWVHVKHRRQGLATLLISQAMKSLGTEMEEVGWYTPFTESSQALARKLCPTDFFVAK